MTDPRPISSTPTGAPAPGDSILGIQGGAVKQFPWNLFDPQAVQQKLDDALPVIEAARSQVEQNAQAVADETETVVAKEAIVSTKHAEVVLKTAEVAVNTPIAVNAQIAATSALLSAIGAASLATSMALSASSVAQQDLSLVTGALHRSPNAVVAQAIYDVSKDSDPGWVLRCPNTSWENEVLQGAWFGWQPTEAHARLVGCTVSAELLPDPELLDATKWTVDNISMSLVGGQAKRLNNANAGGITTANLATPLTQGQIYRVTVKLTNSRPTIALATAANYGSVLVQCQQASNAANVVTAAQVGNVGDTLTFYLTPTIGTVNQVTVYSTVNTYTDIESISLKAVTAVSNNAGGCFGLITDGKFYRPYRNILSGTDDLSVTSIWLHNGANNNVSGSSIGGQSDPLGGTAATKFVPANGVVGAYTNNIGGALPAPGVQYTFWGSIKADGFNFAQIACNTSGGGGIVNATAVFDLTGAGALFSSNGSDFVSASIAAIPGQAGWFIYAINVNSSSVSNSLTPYFRPMVSGTVSATGDGVSGLRIFRPQIETGVFTAAQIVANATTYESKTGTDTTKVEVFRGNKRQFPRMAAIVAEASRVVIYDLLEPGRPMWMVFASVAVTGSSILNWQTTAPAITSVSAREGVLTVGGGGAIGAMLFDFAKDSTSAYCNALFRMTKPRIADRQSTGHSFYASGNGQQIASSSVNAVAMTTMPDAPVDLVTGLQVPTIGVGTVGGASLIQNTGIVANSASTANIASLSLTPYMLIVNAATSQNVDFVLNPKAAGASFAITSMLGGAAPGFNGSAAVGLVRSFTRGVVARRGGSSQLGLMRLNESTPAASLSAWITDTYNTGWMAGDIRRCLLADVSAGVVSGTNLVTNGAFAADVSGWSAQSNVAISWNAGELQGITNSNGNTAAYQDVTTVPGNWYSLTATLRMSSGQPQIFAYNGPFTTLLASNSASFAPDGVNHTGTITFQATGTTTRIGGAPGGVTGVTFFMDNVSMADAVPDRSYKAKPLTALGSLTKTAVAAAAQVVAYSGFSATNYLQEAYSADLDMGTGAWSVSAVASVPAVLPSASFPDVSAELLLTPDFATDTNWTKVTVGTAGAATIAGGVLSVPRVDGSNFSYGMQTFAGSTAKQYRVRIVTTGSAATELRIGTGALGNSLGGPYIVAGGTTTDFLVPAGTATVFVTILANANGTTATVDSISMKEIGPAVIFDRSAPSGAFYRLAVDCGGRLVGAVSDGTTPRTVSSTAAYNTATLIKPELIYDTSGTLSIRVGGQTAGQTLGNPLLTLNNASAVATVGNARTLDAAFPGSILMVKVSATAPSADASAWMWEQEKQMLQPGAQVTLPDAGAVVDLDYDPQEDKWKTVSAANESSFVGLVRTATAPVSAGSFTKVTHKAGIRLVARSTTNPGVDINMPAQNLKEELLRRGESRANAQRMALESLDWLGGFTAAASNGSTWLSNTLTGLSIPIGSTIIGGQIASSAYNPLTTVAQNVTNAGALNGIYLSDKATASGSAFSFLDFILPIGFEARDVFSARQLQQEGSSKDYVRLFDGFRERVRFTTAPGAAAWVRINARRMAA